MATVPSVRASIGKRSNPMRRIVRIIALALAVFFLVPLGYTYGTARKITIEVTDKDRITTGGETYWLVFTKDHDVLQNTDTWFWLKFNSSTVQGRLERGKTYIVRVYGWRFGLFSMYPNIVSIISANPSQ
jgi:hypothetical protein